MELARLFSDLDNLTSDAVAAFWTGRENQLKKQLDLGKPDQGFRGAATGGKHHDGMLMLMTAFLEAAGVPPNSIFTQKSLEIPGYYRPTKKWDLLVIHKRRLLAAVEAKAIVGSFGNNCNNRAEEALGSSTDFWRAQRDEAYGAVTPPWLGFLFIVEDASGSRSPVKVKEPHFPVLGEFKGVSYVERCSLLCRKLVAERQYSAAAFIATKKDHSFSMPDSELVLETFLRSMCGHVQAQILGAK